MKLEFSRRVKRIVEYQISRKSVQWEPSFSVPTDQYDEANSYFSQFRKSA